MNAEIGIHYGVPFAEYLKWDAVNQSALKHMLDSPLHFYHAATEGFEDSEALQLGRALHYATFEPFIFQSTYAKWQKQDGKAAAAMAKDQKLTPAILYSSAWGVDEMADAILKDKHAGPIVSGLGTNAEVSICWEFEGVKCKARIDGLIAKAGLDLKSTKEVPNTRGMTKAIFDHEYALQAAMTLDGLAALGAKRDYWGLIFVEKSAPWAVGTCWLSPDVIRYGRAQYQRCIRQYKQCLASGYWPGPGEVGTVEIPLPRWAAEKEGLTQEGMVYGD